MDFTKSYNTEDVKAKAREFAVEYVKKAPKGLVQALHSMVMYLGLDTELSGT